MADVAETALAYIAFAGKVIKEPGFYVPPHLRDPVQIIRELLVENERLREAVRRYQDVDDENEDVPGFAERNQAADDFARAALAGENERLSEGLNTTPLTDIGTGTRIVGSGNIMPADRPTIGGARHSRGARTSRIKKRWTPSAEASPAPRWRSKKEREQMKDTGDSFNLILGLFILLCCVYAAIFVHPICWLWAVIYGVFCGPLLWKNYISGIKNEFD